MTITPLGSQPWRQLLIELWCRAGLGSYFTGVLTARIFWEVRRQDHEWNCEGDKTQQCDGIQLNHLFSWLWPLWTRWVLQGPETCQNKTRCPDEWRYNSSLNFCCCSDYGQVCYCLSFYFTVSCKQGMISFPLSSCFWVLKKSLVDQI